MVTVQLFVMETERLGFVEIHVHVNTLMKTRIFAIYQVQNLGKEVCNWNRQKDIHTQCELHNYCILPSTYWYSQTSIIETLWD